MSEEKVEVSLEEVKSWNVYQRWYAIMSEWDYVQKRKPTGLKYATVSHDDVAKILQPLLIKYRVVAVPRVTQAQLSNNTTEVWLAVDFVNIDNPTEKIETAMYGQGADNQDKGPGKAISYAFKYSVLKGLCLVTGEDADLESVDRGPKKEAPKEFIKPATPSTYTQKAGCITEGQAKLLAFKRKEAGVVDDLTMRKYLNDNAWKALNEIPSSRMDAVLEFVKTGQEALV